MNCSLAERIMSAAGREESAHVPPLVAWVRRHLPDAGVWPPQRGSGDREPSPDTDEHARVFMVRVFQPLVLQLGAERFGPPSTEVRAAIESITDIEQLQTLAVRVQDPDVKTWDELLAN